MRNRTEINTTRGTLGSQRKMPPKRRKFESTFPAARIKKIMQLDDDVGRVASSVPVVISRAVEIFLQAMLTRGADYAASRNAKTLTVGHLKHCIEQEKQWDFLRELTAKISDVAAQEDSEDATAPKRGRKRKASPPATSSSQQSGPTKRKRKAAAPAAVAAANVDGNGSGNSEEESAPSTTGDRIVGRGMFSQYFNKPSSSTSSSMASVSPLSQDSRHQHNQPSHPPPPTITPHPPSLTTSASNAATLSAMTAGLHHLHGDRTAEEDEDYDT